MTYHLPKPHRHTPSPGSTDIITYRFDDKLVYVPMAHDYNEALAHARNAFPQLRKLCDASLSLSLTSPAHECKPVGISALAWPKLVAHMARYQIIDVHIVPLVPEITITFADSDDPIMGGKGSEPPPYRRSDIVDNEMASCPRPRTLSTTSLHSERRNWFIFQKSHANAP